ncbi:MAG TPA: PilN domain-containing protein [Syntrophomonadaceae bacterium]|nr:PilN domain-containing protein [Syntrophomonadaceae bacterium]
MRDIKINLLTKQTSEKLSWTVIIAIIIAVFLALGMGITYGIALKDLQDQQAIGSDFKPDDTKLKTVQDAMQIERIVKDKLAIKAKHVEGITKQAPLLSQAFDEIELAITPETKLIELEIEDNIIILKGLSKDHTVIADILSVLRQSDTFTSIKLVSIQKDIEEKEAFVIETRWEAPPR